MKSVTLNLRDPKGREMFLDMARKSDICPGEPGPPGRCAGWGWDMTTYPWSIRASSTAPSPVYGQTGPHKVGFYIGDLVTPLFAAYSIMGALREKERTGNGQHLDVSMMDTLAALMFMENLEEDVQQGNPLRTGNNSRGGPTGLYHASDAT